MRPGRQKAKAKRTSGTRGPGTQPSVPPPARSNDRAAGKSSPGHRDRGGGRARLAAPAPRRSPALPFCCPQSGLGPLRPSARRVRELRSEDERGVLAAGTGSPRGDGKRWGEEPRRLRQLPPLRMPRARGQRCRRGRVLWLAAAGAQRSLLARRLSARTRRAGAARLGWPPVPGCMLIRWGGGVPRFLRPTTGAGGRAAAAARSQPPPPAPLLRRGPQTWTQPGHVRRGRGEAPGGPGSVLLAYGVGPLSLGVASALTPHPQGLERSARRPPVSGRAPSVPSAASQGTSPCPSSLARCCSLLVF